jgi:hypothetical protein
VANIMPSFRAVPFETPFSRGVQKFSTCKPWLDPSTDKDAVMFASVQVSVR